MSHKTLAGAIQSKFWGHTQCIFCGPQSEVHYLKIKEGGFCSQHCHNQKWNRFFLISGSLRVIIYRETGEDVTVLEAGQFTDVPPGVFHKFEASTECQCLEVYWTNDLDPNDIERLTFGGMKNEKKESVDNSSAPGKVEQQETVRQDALGRNG